MSGNKLMEAARLLDGVTPDEKAELEALGNRLSPVLERAGRDAIKITYRFVPKLAISDQALRQFRRKLSSAYPGLHELRRDQLAELADLVLRSGIVDRQQLADKVWRCDELPEKFRAGLYIYLNDWNTRHE